MILMSRYNISFNFVYLQMKKDCFISIQNAIYQLYKIICEVLCCGLRDEFIIIK